MKMRNFGHTQILIEITSFYLDLSCVTSYYWQAVFLLSIYFLILNEKILNVDARI